MTEDTHHSHSASLKKLREEITFHQESIKMIVENPVAYNMRQMMAGRPLIDPAEAVRMEANKLKELGEKEMKEELLIEKERVNDVVREYEELHPPVLEPCPICLEDINMNSSAEAYSPFSCCSNFVCKDCCDNTMHNGKIRNCPLCRVPIPADQEVYNQRLIKCVKEKKPKWAQFQLGGKYETGEVGGRVNMKKAFELYSLSAEQGHAPAVLFLSKLYQDGVPGVVNKSPTKAWKYMQQAADMGNYHAMANFAQVCHRGDCGNYTDAVKYATLAHHYHKKSLHASEHVDVAGAVSHFILGTLFLSGDGLSSSSNMAVHYLGAMVQKDTTALGGRAACCFSDALTKQAEDLYNGMHYSGFNVLPRAAYWVRKSVAAGDERAKKIIKRFESMEAGKCQACDKVEPAGQKFLRCSRCRIYYYCSKKCFTAAWEAGHKVDCKSDAQFAKLLNRKGCGEEGSHE